MKMHNENEITRLRGNVVRGDKIVKLLRNIFLYVALVVSCVIALLPFYVMLISSFKTFGETYREFTWWPEEFTFRAYSEVLTTTTLNISFLGAALNTLKIVVPTTLVGLFMSAMAAFIFAKYEFPGKNLLFSMMLSTMMVPGIITMMPQFIIFSEISWVDTPLPLMVPGMFGTAACVFFLRQYMRGLPTDLIEAAKVEGLNKFRIFISIILPLSVPALLSQGILIFISGYNDYLGPLLYLQSSNQYTLQILLAQFSSQVGTDIPVIMAGAMLAVLPLVTIYVFAQKFFISGIAVSGMKA